MIRLMRFALALAAAILIAPALAQAAEQVDLLLVLAADVSRSVDHPKFLLEREGYAAAISDPQVIDVIKSGPHQRIALCFVEWSDLPRWLSSTQCLRSSDFVSSSRLGA